MFGRMSPHSRPRQDRPVSDRPPLTDGPGSASRQDSQFTNAGDGRSIRVGPAALRVARDPVVAILLLAGIFDGLSGNPIHAILLIGVAVALARDAVVGFGGEPAGADVGRPALHLRRWATAALLAGAAVYAALLGRFPRYSWLVTAGVVVPGTLVLVL